MVLAQICAQDVSCLPGNGHLGAGKIADCGTGFKRLAFYLPKQLGGEKFQQSHFLRIPKPPQVVQQCLHTGRRGPQIQAAGGMQVLYDPPDLLPPPETVDRDDGPTYPDPKTTRYPHRDRWDSDTPPEPAGFLRPCALERGKANCPSSSATSQRPFRQKFSSRMLAASFCAKGQT